MIKCRGENAPAFYFAYIMATLKDLIRKNRAYTAGGKTLSESMLEEIAINRIDSFLAEFRSILIQDTKAEIKSITSVVKKGDKGDKGDVGPRGISIKGDAGPQGIKGEPGNTPRRGIDFNDGQQGPKGEKGDAGSPDTPDQVIEKVNKSKKKIQQGQIEGLTETFRSMSNAIREVNKNRGGGSSSGGGMGNIVHESTVVTSATTTVTAARKIAGSGFALWAFYNGQGLTRGTHYTVGSDQKTVTLLFTPDDAVPGSSNTILLIYIRT